MGNAARCACIDCTPEPCVEGFAGALNRRFFLGSFSECEPGLDSPLVDLCLCFPADLTYMSSSDTSTQAKLRFFALRA